MESTSIITLFFLGVSGTGHCLGMCGPLIVAFPGRAGSGLPHLWYHTGRITTYTVLGLLLGSIGLVSAKVASWAGFDYAAALARFQIGFSLIACGFLILFSLSQLGIAKQVNFLLRSNPGIIPGSRYVMNAALNRPSPRFLILTGMFMGLLPCGLSFAAFSKALASTGPLAGGIYLFSFGLGTLPGLLLLGTGVSALYRKYQRHFELISGMLMAGMAIHLFVEVAAAAIDL